MPEIVPLPGFDAPPPIDPGEKISAGRKVTLRQRARIAAGRHPLEGWALGPEGHRCGDCGHLADQGSGRRTYWKCNLRATHSTATDVRISWPACMYWEEPISAVVDRIDVERNRSEFHIVRRDGER